MGMPALPKCPMELSRAAIPFLESVVSLDWWLYGGTVMVLAKRIRILALPLGVFGLLVLSIAVAEGLPRDQYGKPLPTHEVKGSVSFFDGDGFALHFPPHIAETLTA
jgi:hypothetical protein